MKKDVHWADSTAAYWVVHWAIRWVGLLVVWTVDLMAEHWVALWAGHWVVEKVARMAARTVDS